MSPIFKKIALLTSVAILLLFLIFVVNETVQIVQLAERMNPKLGVIVLWALLYCLRRSHSRPRLLILASPPVSRAPQE